VIVTLAPGITAPLESVTAPAIVPVYDCALRNDAHTDTDRPNSRLRFTSMGFLRLEKYSPRSSGRDAC
jgi:hypothetical protein